jgi:hypothetical protein
MIYNVVLQVELRQLMHAPPSDIVNSIDFVMEAMLPSLLHEKYVNGYMKPLPRGHNRYWEDIQLMVIFGCLQGECSCSRSIHRRVGQIKQYSTERALGLDSQLSLYS